MRQLMMILPLGLLAACAPQGDAPGKVPGRGGDLTTCGADRIQSLVGQAVTQLPGDELSGPLRLIRPESIVTADFNAQRINVTLNGSDQITAITCG